MGITGLIPLLRSITRRVDLRMFSGEVVAVDAYSWLHKVFQWLHSDNIFVGLLWKVRP
jgi:hypothetical protein